MRMARIDILRYRNRRSPHVLSSSLLYSSDAVALQVLRWSVLFLLKACPVLKIRHHALRHGETALASIIVIKVFELRCP
ncbi:hypothetical protein SAMN05446635_0300 [Burkholderia sp. OK233]|nr:hypothetical protein SAMN05446635_0300 [Burkholderia sp. OK233]